MKLLKNFLNHFFLEKPMKGGDFIFDYVHLLHFKCHKINPNRSGSNTDFPDWIKI